MGKLAEIHILPKPTLKEIDNMNRAVTSMTDFYQVNRLSW